MTEKLHLCECLIWQRLFFKYIHRHENMKIMIYSSNKIIPANIFLSNNNDQPLAYSLILSFAPGRWTDKWIDGSVIIMQLVAPNLSGGT